MKSFDCKNTKRWENNKENITFFCRDGVILPKSEKNDMPEGAFRSLCTPKSGKAARRHAANGIFRGVFGAKTDEGERKNRCNLLIFNILYNIYTII